MRDKINQYLSMFFKWWVRRRWPAADIFSRCSGTAWNGVLYDTKAHSFTGLIVDFPEPVALTSEWQAWARALIHKDRICRYGPPLLGLSGRINFWSANVAIHTPRYTLVLLYWDIEPMYGFVQSGYQLMRHLPAKQSQGLAGSMLVPVSGRITRKGIMQYAVSVEPFNFEYPTKEPSDA